MGRKCPITPVSPVPEAFFKKHEYSLANHVRSSFSASEPIKNETFGNDFLTGYALTGGDLGGAMAYSAVSSLLDD